jgi:hypothetical protein
MLGPLGQRHLSYGVLESHYPIVGETLLQTFEQELGENWTDDYAAAWSEVYSNAARIMQEGAAKANAQNPNTIETAVKPERTGALEWLYWRLLPFMASQIGPDYSVPAL